MTARPAGPRTSLRIVLDSQASLSSESQLVQTAREFPLLVAPASDAPSADCQRLEAAGVEVLKLAGAMPAERLEALLDELGKRRLTNLLVEGGAQVLGTMFDARAIDEVHAFIAPKIAGGAAALSPIGGSGARFMETALNLSDPQVEVLDGDVYVRGRVGVNGTT